MTTSNVKQLPLPERFDCTNGGAQFCQGCYTMTPDDHGDYVRAEDYDALKANAEALRAEVERLTGCLEQANNNAEEFERKWYLASDEVDRMQKGQLLDANVIDDLANTVQELQARAERLQAEIDNRWAMGVHTCHENCQRQSCVQFRRAERLAKALRIAEAALVDIGYAGREPGDDVAWCERRAAWALPAVRAALHPTAAQEGKDA